MVEVMIIRPEKEIGMGCCGGVCSDRDGFIHMEEEFNHHDKDRKRLGELYQQTIRDYGDQVMITYVDPRNLLAIVVYFIKQVRRKSIRPSKALSYLFFQMKYNAVFVNGRMTKDQLEYDSEIKNILHT